jgi:hypothetical protein
MGQVFPPNGVLYPDDALADRRPLLGSAVYDLMIPRLARAEEISEQQAAEILEGMFVRLAPPRPPVAIWPETLRRCRELLASAQAGSQLGHDIN